MVRLGVLLAAALLAPTTALTDQIQLPTPDAAQVQSVQLLKQLPNFRPDRLLPSDVPGPVVNDEKVMVGVGGDGSVQRVLLDQRLKLTGVGDYAVRERGPARSAVSLTTDPAPITRRGAVVWQGFSPGSRSLGAELVLDPLIEAVHLPLSVHVIYTGADGKSQSLPAGGVVPGAGTVRITIQNDTEQPQSLPTATDVSAAVVAPVLDRALSVARLHAPARLLSTDAGLPKTVPVVGAAQEQASQAVPFRVDGTFELTGTTGRIDGPAITPTADGGTFGGVLGGVDGTPAITYSVTTAGRGTLAFSLTAYATLDPRLLAPPRGFRTWTAWAASRPPLAERKAALDLLVQVAATGARASSYSPYLGADLAGTGTTTFSYSFAPAVHVAAARPTLHAKWGAISLLLVGLLVLLGAGGLVWRRL